MAVHDVVPEVREISQALVPEIDDLGVQMAERIRAELPVYRDEQLIGFDEVVATCRANLHYVLDQLAGIASPHNEVARFTGERRAVLGVPYDSLLQAYRIGGRYIWELLVSRSTPESRDALLRSAADVWAVTDQLSMQVTEGYRRALADQVRRDGQRRSVVVGAVLGGEVGEGDELWQAAAVLDMTGGGDFVVVAAECRATGAEALPGIERTLRRENLTSAWRLEHDRQEGLVQLRPGSDVARLTVLLEGVTEGRVGVSAPFSRLSLAAEALRAARTACLASNPAGNDVTRYDQVPLAILIATAPEQGASLARTVLGPVLDLPAEDRSMLVETARVWLAQAGSSSAAARELHLHRNSVRYRLRRLEQLTGRDLSRPVDAAEAYVALECARILGLA